MGAGRAAFVFRIKMIVCALAIPKFGIILIQPYRIFIKIVSNLGQPKPPINYQQNISWNV